MKRETRAVILERLEKMSFKLPELGDPAYSYVPFSRHGEMIHISGQISRTDDGEILGGRVGETASVDEGRRAAQVAALNLLARMDQAAGLENISGILKINVWVSSASEFSDQPAVAEGASVLLREVLGDAGRHARTALPAHVLPKNSLVEIDAVVTIHG